MSATLVVVRVFVIALSMLAGFLMGAGIGAWPVAGALAGGLLGALAVWLEWRAGRLPLDHTVWGVVGGAVGVLGGRVVGGAVLSLVPDVGAAGRLLPELLGVQVYKPSEFQEKVDWMMNRGFLKNAPSYTDVVRGK